MSSTLPVTSSSVAPSSGTSSSVSVGVATSTASSTVTSPLPALRNGTTVAAGSMLAPTSMVHIQSRLTAIGVTQPVPRSVPMPSYNEMFPSNPVQGLPGMSSVQLRAEVGRSEVLRSTMPPRFASMTSPATEGVRGSMPPTTLGPIPGMRRVDGCVCGRCWVPDVPRVALTSGRTPVSADARSQAAPVPSRTEARTVIVAVIIPELGLILGIAQTSLTSSAQAFYRA